MSDEEKLISHYRLKTLLRKDGFGAVYAAEDTRDQKECVLRVIELDQNTLKRITGKARTHAQREHALIEQIRQRMKRISELKNSHVLPVIEFGEEHIQGNNDIIFYMVSPYEKESLLSYWSAHTSSAELISLEIVTELLEQAADALYYVHRRGLVHQYVRLSSFMLHKTARSHRLHVYLTDFWFADISAAILEEGQVAQDLSVYLASEQLAGRAVAASDQYALAILIYELLLGYRLSGVDLSLGLYERFVRQRGAEVSTAEIELARRIDLVLARALAEDATARYHNIEEFASLFRAVALGEMLELQEDTAKLPAMGYQGGQKSAELAAAAVGALAAGEIVAEISGTWEEEVTETQVESDETTLRRHPSLHKTVLTSEGMEAAEVVVGSEVLAETSISEQATVVSETAQGETVVAEAATVVEEEQTQPSAGVTGAAGFVAGLAVGEILQSATDISEEQTQIAESSAAAFAAGEAALREADSAREGGLLAESAAGLAAGEILQRKKDLAEEEKLRAELAEEHTLRIESSAAAFAAGLAAGAALQHETGIIEKQTERGESSAAVFAAGTAAGLVAGAALQREKDIAEEQTQIIPIGGAAAGTIASEEEIDIAEEETQIIPVGGALLAGAAGLAAGEVLAGELEETAGNGAAGAGLVAGGVLAGEIEQTQLAGAGFAAGGVAGGAGVIGGGAVGGGVIGGGVVGGGATGTGAIIPPPPPARRRRRRGRTWLIAAIIALLLVLLFGVLGVYALNQSSATVTLTLQSHTIQNTYLVTATTSSTSVNGQVQASFFKQSASLSKSGKSTGYYQGSQSSGFIKFYNSSTGCGCPTIIPAGTEFTGASGVTVVTDEVASVASLCYVTVHAHALIYSPGGDIPAGDIQASYSSKISAGNPYAFGGGQFGQSNALVQQSDIDHLARTLRTQVEQNAQAVIQTRLTSSQHLFAQADCKTKVKSAPPAGSYATSFTVTASTTCSAEAYDYSAAIQIVTQQVQNEASSFSNDEFILIGGLRTSVSSATVTDAQGTLLLAVKAVGKWVRKLAGDLKSYIAGKPVSDARALLLQLGASNVAISVSGRDPNMLPSDSSKITIVTKS